MRTTIDIDAPLLRELKELGRQDGRSLGRVVSDLLAKSLVEERRQAPPAPAFRWLTRRMGALVDIDDRDAVYGAMDGR